MDNQTIKKFIISVVISIVAYAISLSFFGEIQSRLIACIVFLVTLWTNEALPLGVVSLLPIILFPSLDILSTNETSINYSNSIIFLFLGGFLLAIAVEKIGLHKIIAQKMFHVFPRSPRGLIYALTIISALLSSLLSNTTTALLLMPIAIFLTDVKELKIRFVLAIAYGASIGGIMTPVGTPPNLILMGFIQNHGLEPIAFFTWMLKVIPLSALMLLVIPFILSLKVNHLDVDFHDKIENEHLNKEQKRLSIFLGILVFLLMLNSPIKPFYDGLGLSEAGILLGFGILMFVPNIGFINWADSKRVPYEIIFLFGAGFSIANAFSSTNLANDISTMLLQLTTLSPFILILLVAVLITFTTEITSNTALISIALPIIYSLGVSTGMDVEVLLMVATVCASYAFMLPIATPPNAIAMSSGVLSIKQMAGFGFIFNICAIVFTSIFAYFIW